MSAIYGQVAGQAACGYVGESAVHQSEVERELRKLLETAEELDNTASKLIGCIEKVTRPEPPASASTADGRLAACPGTTLGRDLDGLNNRFRATMTVLQSTIHRIEL